MAPSWLNLSAHLNKSNVGCVPAIASFSFSNFLLRYFSRRTFAIFIVRGASIHSLVPTRAAFAFVLRSADIFAQYLKRLLMEIAIMPSAFSPLSLSPLRRRESILPKGLILTRRSWLSRFHWPSTHPLWDFHPSRDVKHIVIGISIVIKI